MTMTMTMDACMHASMTMHACMVMDACMNAIQDDHRAVSAAIRKPPPDWRRPGRTSWIQTATCG